MSPSTAFVVLTWAAIILLALGLAAVLREVRLLRATVLGDADGFQAAPPDIELGPRFAHGTGWRVVLAGDSGCPLCRQVADRLATVVPGSTLLTHESADTWQAVADRLDVVSDEESWRQISHLSPPVLMLVDGTARVRRLSLPTRVEDVGILLSGWHRLIEEENRSGVDARAHS